MRWALVTVVQTCDLPIEDSRRGKGNPLGRDRTLARDLERRSGGYDRRAGIPQIWGAADTMASRSNRPPTDDGRELHVIQCLTNADWVTRRHDILEMHRQIGRAHV